MQGSKKMEKDTGHLSQVQAVTVDLTLLCGRKSEWAL
jgi:hypothetical protein